MSGIVYLLSVCEWAFTDSDSGLCGLSDLDCILCAITYAGSQRLPANFVYVLSCDPSYFLHYPYFDS
jgi:hypothetical protein